MIRDMPLTLAIVLCTPIYIAVIAKFVYERSKLVVKFKLKIYFETFYNL